MRMKRVDHLFDIVFSILLLSLSISMAIPNILLGFLFLLFFLSKKKYFQFFMLNYWAYLFCLFLRKQSSFSRL